MDLDKTYCMDCLEGLKLLEDDSIDLVVTDPPYNLKKDFENDDLTEEQYVEFLSPIMSELARVIKPKRSVIIFFDAGKKMPLFWKCLFNSDLIFQKCGFLYKDNDESFPHNRILRKSEAWMVCSKTPELNHDGESYISDVLIFNYGHLEREWYHPTAKNIKAIRALVKSHSVQNEVVLDPFMGSGTTALAAQQLRRHFIGFEINPEFMKVIKLRLEQKSLPNIFEAISND